MMSGPECRAKAREALEGAKASTNPELRRAWEQTAADWAALAITADLQEQLEQDLIDKTPS